MSRSGLQNLLVCSILITGLIGTGCRNRTSGVNELSQSSVIKNHNLHQMFLKQINRGNYEEARDICREAARESKRGDIREYANYLYFMSYFMRDDKAFDFGSAKAALKRYLQRFPKGNHRNAASGLLDMMGIYSSRLEECRSEKNNMQKRLITEERCCSTLDSLRSEIKKLERVILKIEKARIQ